MEKVFNTPEMRATKAGRFVKKIIGQLAVHKYSAMRRMKVTSERNNEHCIRVYITAVDESGGALACFPGALVKELVGLLPNDNNWYISNNVVTVYYNGKGEAGL